MKTYIQLALVCGAFAYLASAAPHVVSMATRPETAPPVNVTVYYETMCIACQVFITASLLPTWHDVKDLNIMTATLVPYGNAKEEKVGSKWKFTCQHGENECMGNILETCILHHYPNTSQHLEMINCIELSFFNTAGITWDKALDSCKHTGVDVEKISTCTTGDEGNQLEHIMATKTGPHSWVPWVLINGVHIEDATIELLSQVCAAYTPVQKKVTSGFLALRQIRAPMAELEPATEGSLRISERIRYPLCH
ncbi:interferon-gamma-inducible lysosomal thiol reductase [Plakobranchus ocellatus]|uniref:Interferon-gamma-inducible lysosomal thiol reductase n=1 Tax=Plakobranchus ocellatus TaxID=259542 RepID=A0AAV4CCK8_9GAST|nr:interferon-gamma-inducible lysosomal thiol reductase [Plakobranchus ocellatus]